MRVLLVEPEYYTRYPPLGLLKLGTYHKSYGNTVQLVRGCTDNGYDPDQIEITSLFTYAWKPVHKAIEYYQNLYPNAQMRIGGIYASLLPENIKKLYPEVIIHCGLYNDLENYLPAYSLLEQTDKWREWNSSIVFASRGCIRRCPFCAVPSLEGRIRPIIDDIHKYIYKGHKKVIFWDNNIFASPNWRSIFNQLLETKIKVDFNQGLDARLIDNEKAEYLARLRMDSIRLAYDDIRDRQKIGKAVDLLNKYGINRRKIFFYVLYNFFEQSRQVGDTPEQFLTRIKEIITLGCVAYPMRFEPLDSLKKNQYISPLWNADALEMVAKARRVIGYGGAFPPYDGLLDKLNRASSFEKAFELRPINNHIQCDEDQIHTKAAIIP